MINGFLEVNNGFIHVGSRLNFCHDSGKIGSKYQMLMSSKWKVIDRKFMKLARFEVSQAS